MYAKPGAPERESLQHCIWLIPYCTISIYSACHGHTQKPETSTISFFQFIRFLEIFWKNQKVTVFAEFIEIRGRQLVLLTANLKYVIIYIIIDRCAPGFAESKSETHKNARDFDSSDIFKDTIH